MLADFDGFYRQVDDRRFEPSVHVQGAWQEDEQHMAPVAGLLTHSLETHRPRPELQLCRVNFEILGMIRAEVSEIEVEVLRPGRTIELLEARLRVAGRLVVRATAWRLSRHDTSEVATEPVDSAVLPAPEDCARWDGAETWPGGYIRSLDIRRSPDSRPARARAWIRTAVPLIEHVEVSALAAFTGLVDTANGIGARVDPRQWMFPNTDLTIHYFRTPTFPDRAHRWVGFDTAVAIGSEGVGLTSSTLHDRSGPVGRAEQILTVRRLG